MHSNNKLGLHKSTALFRVGESPNATQGLIRQTGSVKDGTSLIPRQLVSLKILPLKERRVLGYFFLRQGRDPDACASARSLCLDRSSRCEAIESWEGTGLERYILGGFSASLCMTYEPKNGTEASGCEKAAILLVGYLPDLPVDLTSVSLRRITSRSGGINLPLPKLLSLAVSFRRM